MGVNERHLQYYRGGGCYDSITNFIYRVPLTNQDIDRVSYTNNFSLRNITISGKIPLVGKGHPVREYMSDSSKTNG